MTSAPDAVELTRQLIAHKTINPPGEEEACAKHLGSILQAAGFDIIYREYAPKRTSLIAHFKGTGQGLPICFAGHIDTVPLGSIPWAVDPFAGEIRDGRLHGRGASDMKSGVAAMVAAAVRLAGMDDTGPLTLIAVAGEETGCDGSFHLARVPDEIGPVGALVVAEPTSNYPLVGHKGAFWLKATTSGKTAHGSMPEKGDNAIYKAARAILRAEDFDPGIAPHPHLGPSTINVGNVSGGININSVADKAAFGIDLRTIPGQDHDEVLKRLEDQLGDEVEFNVELSVPSLWTDPNDPWVRQVFGLMAPILGEAVQVRTVAFFTDAAALTPALGNVPTIILGPGEPGLAHCTDEYCEVAKIGQAVDAYVVISKRWHETGGV